MKLKVRLKIIVESRAAKWILSLFIVALLITVILLPSILTARPKGSVLAFNRDATSGTREAFVEKVLMPEEHGGVFSPGKNVREASNNESMIRAAMNNKNSVSYVSFGTIAEFDSDGNAKVRDNIKNIDFASFEGVSPDLDEIKNGNYYPSRNFNAFFRVEKGSLESEILKYDFSNNTIESNVTDLPNNLKASYFFYSWMNESNAAIEIINSGSEISFNETGIDFNRETAISYSENVSLNTNEEIRIEIVGSTSANKVLNELEDEFKSEIELQFSNINIQFVNATNGSGDAFKESVPGAQESYIGLQSREAKESEYSNWGWNLDELDQVYKPFAIDAILIIFNNQDLEYEGRLNTTSDLMWELYANDNYIYYENLFTNYNEVIE